jgi:2Fe-2S ferredoxin
MTPLTFIEHNGTQHQVSGESGHSLMQIANDHAVPGVLGDCGGNGSCATCHGYIDPPWQDRLAPPSADEDMMLDGVMERQPGSRLTCQIKMTEALAGLVVRWPASQM